MAPNRPIVDSEVTAGITALRVQAYPDGGLARFRALGRPTAAGMAELKSRWDAAL